MTTRLFCDVPGCMNEVKDGATWCDDHPEGQRTSSYIGDSYLEQIKICDQKLSELATQATQRIRIYEKKLEHLKLHFMSSRPEHRIGFASGLWTMGWGKVNDTWSLIVSGSDDETIFMLAAAPRLIRILAAKQLDSFVIEAANQSELQCTAAFKK